MGPRFVRQLLGEQLQRFLRRVERIEQLLPALRLLGAQARASRGARGAHIAVTRGLDAPATCEGLVEGIEPAGEWADFGRERATCLDFVKHAGALLGREAHANRRAREVATEPGPRVLVRARLLVRERLLSGEAARGPSRMGLDARDIRTRERGQSLTGCGLTAAPSERLRTARTHRPGGH